MIQKPYVEENKEWFCDRVIASDVRPATEEEIREAEEKHARGQCDHKLIYDEPCFLVTERLCAVCGKSLDMIL